MQWPRLSSLMFVFASAYLPIEVEASSGPPVPEAKEPEFENAKGVPEFTVALDATR